MLHPKLQAGIAVCAAISAVGCPLACTALVLSKMEFDAQLRDALVAALYERTMELDACRAECYTTHLPPNEESHDKAPEMRPLPPQSSPYGSPLYTGYNAHYINAARYSPMGESVGSAEAKAYSSDTARRNVDSIQQNVVSWGCYDGLDQFSQCSDSRPLVRRGIPHDGMGGVGLCRISSRRGTSPGFVF